ncbi:MAG TPA: hypothetical protein V6C91_16175 [Coleofasciculaceae cyanobacterium]
MSRASARTFHGTTLALAPITHGDKFIMPYKERLTPWLLVRVLLNIQRD